MSPGAPLEITFTRMGHLHDALSCAYGEVWNGLARMRRHIEIQLNQYISNLDPALADRNSRLSAGRLLAVLVRLGRISERSEKQLRYALDVANAGIHGNDVSVAQAQEAWEAGVRGLALLSLPG
jgi:hypothetical protein